MWGIYNRSCLDMDDFRSWPSDETSLARGDCGRPLSPFVFDDSVEGRTPSVVVDALRCTGFLDLDAERDPSESRSRNLCMLSESKSDTFIEMFAA